MAAPTAPTKTNQPGPSLLLSIAVFVIGALLVSVGGFLAFTGAFESLTAESFELPGTQERELEPGDYDIFASTGSVTNFGGFSDVDASDVTVTNVATNETVDVRNQNLDLTLNRQTTSYVAIGIFTVEDAGTYEIEISSDASDRAVVGRSLLDSWEQVRIPLVAAGVGLVLTLIGTVMIVVGIVRRNRAKKAQRPPGPAWQAGAAGPPSGYPGAPPPTPAAQGMPTAPTAPPTTTAPPASTTAAPGTAPSPAPPPPGIPGPADPPQSPTDSDTPWG